jgi:hypothetical protein
MKVLIEMFAADLFIQSSFEPNRLQSIANKSSRLRLVGE